ncbi:MAG TPA: biotin/lipoyl-binding protein [Pseudonocardiaceae bacterium]|nr:biotin/lipoyl-binding protein [Pseudonocardiaceae bacterium]
MKPVITIRRMLARRWLIVGAVIAVAGVAITAWAWASSSSAAAPRLGTASLDTIRQTVSATGTIEAAQQANLSFGVTGQVTAVPVSVGQQVKAGQTLATLDAASLPSQVAQAKAAVAASEARVAADQASGASAAQINADNAAVTSSNAQLAVAQQNLSRATLTAPFDGTVAAVNLTAGQQISGASPASSGTSSGGSGGSGPATAASSSSLTPTATSSASNAQVVVISTGAYIVSANVDDTEVSQLRSGDQAVITLNSSTNQIFGSVASVGMVGTQSSGITTYPVTIGITGNPGTLPIGATAQISIIVKQLTDVVVVPRAAVHTVGGRSVVYELQNGKQVAHPVTVGLSTGGQTQITDGLTAGTRIVLPATPTGTAPNRPNGANRGGGLGGGFGGGFGGGLGGGGRGPGGRTG